MKEEIKVVKATKGDFFSKVQPFQEQMNPTKINNLLDSLVDDIQLEIEYPYVDSHYRDSYYLYYAKKLSDYKRDCIRVHLFTPTQDSKWLYSGYFIIRPLEQVALGKAMINPRALKKHPFVTCLVHEKVNLVGQDLEVYGFPYVAQDAETHTCAESALWVLLQYFGEKYKSYKTFLPSDIIKILTNTSNRRLLPSKGLTVDELSNCLNSTGQNCLIYTCETTIEQASKRKLVKDSTTGLKCTKSQIELFNLLNIYIESGMPAIASIHNESIGHAIVIIGHKEIDSDFIYLDMKKNVNTWLDVSNYKRSFIVMDDNMPPYEMIHITTPAENYTESEWNGCELGSFVLPFHKHMFMDAKVVLDLVTNIFNNKKIGLKTFSSKWVTRLLLTSSTSYKTFVQKSVILDKRFKHRIAHTQFSKFIWICELYEIDHYKDKKVNGILIIDATGDASYNSIILYYIDDNKISVNDAYSFKETEKLNESFLCEPYQNNLKGEWSEWRS